MCQQNERVNQGKEHMGSGRGTWTQRRQRDLYQDAPVGGRWQLDAQHSEAQEREDGGKTSRCHCAIFPSLHICVEAQYHELQSYKENEYR